jgi:hypothetical protein
MTEVDELLRLARGAVEKRLEPGNDRSGLLRLTRAATKAHTPAPRRPWWAIGGLAAVTAGLVIVAVGRPRPAPVASLTYTVESTPAAEAIAEAATMRWRFTDGTTVAAANRMAVQVEDVAIDEPRVRINQRLAHVHVVHRPRRHWTFLAGPFQVLVTGTTFDLGWDPAPETLSLRLVEGSVTLSGPHVPGGSLAVRAGERVEVALGTGQMTVESDHRAVPSVAATKPALPRDTHDLVESPPSIAPTPSAPPAAVRHPAHDASWGDLIRRGQFQQVIDQARARRWSDCAARCSGEELRALGDAARYLNRLALAERAFQALRARGTGSAEGTAAAYLLGRTFEAGKRWTAADRWYAQYLLEAPGGAFAVEASSGRRRVAAQRGARESDRE